MGAPTLIIAGFELQQESRLDFQQTFERVDGGASSRRLAGGALFSMQHWERWATTVSGSGYVPAPLLSIRRGEPFELHSVAPIALKPGEDLPAGWAARTDWPEKTFTSRLGVEIRLVYPILTVASALGARLVVGGTYPQWEIACEEV